MGSLRWGLGVGGEGKEGMLAKGVLKRKRKSDTPRNRMGDVQSGVDWVSVLYHDE